MSSNQCNNSSAVVESKNGNEAVSQRPSRQCNDILNEVNNSMESEYNNYESEVEIEIPIEENYLKSSTSLSGDDDAVEYSSLSRPRSVHFEDEYWDQDHYASKGLSKSDGLLYAPSYTKYEDRNGRKGRGSNQSLENNEEYSADLLQAKPFNVKKPKGESVREMLRKRRECVEEVLETDGRRRLKSLDNRHLRTSRSSSRETSARRGLDRETKYVNNGLIKSQSLHNVQTSVSNRLRESTSNARLQGRVRQPRRSVGDDPVACPPPANRSMTRQRLPAFDNQEAAFISQKNFAMLQSLVGLNNSTSSSSSSTHSQQREIQKKVFTRTRKKSSRHNSGVQRYSILVHSAQLHLHFAISLIHAKHLQQKYLI